VNPLDVPVVAAAPKAGLKFAWFMGIVLSVVSLVATGTSSLAQSGGKPKPARVAVAEVKTEIIADFADLSGRVVAGSTEYVTAVHNAEINILDLQLGDMVKTGQKIAQQDHAKLSLNRTLFQMQLTESQLKKDDIAAEIESEIELLALGERQAALLERKAVRAEGLVANNALPVDAAETALNNSLAAQQKLLSQKSGLTRKKAQLALTGVAIDRLRAQIKQIDADIAATTLRAQSTGQIIFLVDYRRGFAREGEVIARILNPSIFEVEVEVPVSQLPFLKDVDVIAARTLDEKTLTLAPRVILPVQNTRTGTRVVRFRLAEMPLETVLADNAVVTVQLPITSPSPVVIVPKDAVIPVVGGHIVYLAKDGRAQRQPIKLGAAVSSGFIVRSGLEAGAIVVTRGNEQLSDGKAIEFGDKKANAQDKVDS